MNMFNFFKNQHAHLSDRDLLITVLVNQFSIIQKLESFMSQTTDLIAKLGEDIAGIAADVATIGQEITDLKNKTDDPATVSALTDLEGKAAATKAALDSLIPAPATGGDTTPPTETPAV